MNIVFWILALLLSVAAGYWVYLADKKRKTPYPWLLAALRTIVVFLTCLLLLTPLISIHKNEIQKPLILFLQDNSESIGTALHTDSNRYKQDAESLLSRLKKDYKVIQWGFGNRIQKDSLFSYTQQATDISKALSQAVAYYGQQNLSAILLATDGRFNEGYNPQFQELAYQGSLYAVAIGDTSAQKDLRITAVYANKTVALNSRFEIRADIVADNCAGYNNRIQLAEAGGNATGSEAVSITTHKFDKSVSLTIKAEKPGLHHYILTAPAADGEKNTANNRKDIYVEVVSEKKNILIAAAAPHPDVNALREALNGLENYTLTVRTGSQFPTDLSPYQVLILHNLPTASIPLAQVTKAAKPVWYIMGQGTDAAAIAQAQIAKLNVQTQNLQQSFAQYTSSFSTFTMPAQVKAVMDKMPPLASPAGNIEAAPNTSTLFSSKTNQQPIWMLQPGNTPKALLAGEGLWRWRMYEYRFFRSHEVVDEAIRQTIAFLSANVHENPFRVEISKYIWSDREAISLNAYLLNANNEQVNTAEVNITLTDSTGKKQSYSFERSGTAYKLNIGIRAAGTYTYTAQTVYNGKTYVAKGSFSVHNMPLELMEAGADFPMLYRLSHQYNGAVVAAKNITSLYDSIRLNETIKPVIQSTEDSIPLIDWKWFFFLILLFAVVEWLLRKYWMAQ